MPVHKFNYQVITQTHVYFTSLGSPVARATKHPDLEKAQHTQGVQGETILLEEEEAV